MPVEDLGAVFVEGGLRGGVLSEDIGEGFEIIEEVRVREMAALEIAEEGGETGGCGEGEEGVAVL